MAERVDPPASRGAGWEGRFEMKAVKTIKLVLAYRPDAHEIGDQHPYQVTSIENSTEYHPGQRLKKATVDEVNKRTRWTVKVTG